MLAKSIYQTAQKVANVQSAASQAALAGAVIGSAASAASQIQPGEGPNPVERSRARVFAEEGLVGVLTNELIGARKEEKKPQNQEQPAGRRRGAMGRFIPRQQEPPVMEEERKTPESSPVRAEEDQPLLQQEEQPSASIISQQQDAQIQTQPQRPINQQDVEVIVQERANEQQRRDPSYLKMASAFLIGQVMNTDTVIKIMDALHKWWIQSKETETMNDPWYESARVEEIIQRPVPEGCKRIIYRDAQTHELKTVVICGAQGERIYPGK